MTPEEVKSLTESELLELAERLRAQIVECVAANGGHLAASLGTVELSIGLMRTFSPPEDKVLWDVGHQAYAWKMLTGREEAFARLRQRGGISGFPWPAESPCDAFVAGHAGSALAAAIGMAAARDRFGGGNVVAVVGDASLTNGESLEALNSCATLAKKMIIVVNDNAMSISKSVGSFARTLGRLLSDVRYNKAKAAAERMGHRMRLTFLRDSYHRVEQAVKSFWLANSLFESLGLRYVGPVDGHNLDAVVSALTVAKDDKRPVVVHVVTRKGKGFAPAEADPTAWHGVGPFDIEASVRAGVPVRKGRENREPARGAKWSEVFGEAMVEAARRDGKVCAVVAAMRRGTGLDQFAEAFPDRFFDVGICEEMAVTFAAGLAKAGMKPVVAIYSTFLQRAIDQIQHDVCLQRLPVVFAVDRAGCVGEDGPTHHGLYDIPLLRPLTGMRIAAPTSAEELRTILDEALSTAEGPVAIRYPKGVAPEKSGPSVVSGNGHAGCMPLPSQCAMRNGQPVLCAVGDQVEKAREVQARLASAGISVDVIPVSGVKPPSVTREQTGGRFLVTFENGVVTGGFGESIGADMRFGWPDAVIGLGTVEEIERAFGFDAESIFKAIEKRVRNG